MSKLTEKFEGMGSLVTAAEVARAELDRQQHKTELHRKATKRHNKNKAARRARRSKRKPKKRR